MLITCGRHEVPLYDAGPDGLFCPACEYNKAIQQEPLESTQSILGIPTSHEVKTYVHLRVQ